MTARIVTGGTFPAAAAWSPGQQALAGGQRGDSPVAACNAMRDSPMLKSRVEDDWSNEARSQHPPSSRRFAGTGGKSSRCWTKASWAQGQTSMPPYSRLLGIQPASQQQRLPRSQAVLGHQEQLFPAPEGKKSCKRHRIFSYSQ